MPRDPRQWNARAPRTCPPPSLLRTDDRTFADHEIAVWWETIVSVSEGLPCSRLIIHCFFVCGAVTFRYNHHRSAETARSSRVSCLDDDQINPAIFTVDALCP